jgi:hypothetical protein
VPEEVINLGNINFSNISGGSIQAGDITTNITASGDLIGRDKFVHNITNIVERALTAAEEAEKARAIAAQRLAEGVRDYAQRLASMANQISGTSAASPYKGLLAYRLSDTALFFGRDQAIVELLQHLQRGSLVILQSESGAGKSSLLQAGISPLLLANGHLLVYLRPYNTSPSLTVKQAFLPNLDDTPALAKASLRDFLRQVTAVLGQSVTLCLILDQFEEFFTLLDEAQQNNFIDELAECLDDEALNVRWVLAIRTEFFGRLADFQPRIKNPFTNNCRLNQLTRTDAERVITAPAKLQGITFEPTFHHSANV